MGASLSTEGCKEEKVCEGTVPSTPIQAIRHRLLDNDRDPRSPSLNIARTPIEVLSTPSTIKNKENLTPLRVLATDPRSPSLEITRTPISISDTSVMLPSKIHNKLLDNAKKPVYDVTPLKRSPRANETDKKFIRQSPKLLESSPMFKVPDNKRHSIVGLLETNLDFIETDIDEAFLNKMNSPSCKSDNFETIVSQIELVEEETPLEKSLNELIQNSKVEESEIVEKSSGEIDQSDEKLEENFEIDRNVTVVFNENIPTEIKQAEKLEIQEKELSATPNKFTAGMEELDRKLSNLIYEDKNCTTTLTKKRKENSRTPLGDKNSRQSSRLSKLKVNDFPTKMSKIPVFKNKCKVKSGVQCENTPPANMNFNRTEVKKSQWSTEDSIII